MRRLKRRASHGASRESLGGENKPMGVSIGLLAAMLQRKTDSSVEQRLEVEVPWTSGTAFRSGAGGTENQRQEGQEVRRRTSAADEGKTSKGVSPRNPGIREDRSGGWQQPPNWESRRKGCEPHSWQQDATSLQASRERASKCSESTRVWREKVWKPFPRGPRSLERRGM